MNLAAPETPFRPAPLCIGNLCIDPPLILAPMAGVTDQITRRIVAEHGAGLVTSEMVSVQGMVRNQSKTLNLCAQESDLPVPLAVQIFGRDPETMAEAARRVEGGGAALIDINAGCPVRKVVRQGAGASLLREPEQLARVAAAVKEAVGVPVTVKIRLGWDEHHRNAVEVAQRLADAGVDAITIHGRTASQHYSGEADWEAIALVKAAVSVPIIGNGDITSPARADAMFRQTGCDAVMIGRASQGNPWLFSVIASRWSHQPLRVPDWPDFLETVHRHIEELLRVRGEVTGHCRKLLLWYSKGCPDSAGLRAHLTQIDSADRMLQHFTDWVRLVMGRGLQFLPMKVPEAALEQL